MQERGHGADWPFYPHKNDQNMLLPIVLPCATIGIHDKVLIWNIVTSVCKMVIVFVLQIYAPSMHTTYTNEISLALVQNILGPSNFTSFDDLYIDANKT